jgi:proteic killer suppression protein
MLKSSQVTFSKFSEKQITKLPLIISEALYIWVQSVETMGIANTRKLRGYHDESLKGDRKGQRSARLNKSYRVIYIETDLLEFVVISVLEVNKHDY